MVMRRNWLGTKFLSIKVFHQVTTYLVRFQVLTAASMKMTVFWHVACSLVEVYRRFRGAFCLHYQGDESSLFIDVHKINKNDTQIHPQLTLKFVFEYA
jgi:hypothetical protein